MAGMLSMCFWLCAQLPQIVKNHKTGQAEALSWAFLFIWLLGDVSNFLGCILSKRLAFQLYLATYFVLVDVLLLGQRVCFRRHRTIGGVHDDEERLLLRPSAASTPVSNDPEINCGGHTPGSNSAYKDPLNSHREDCIFVSLSDHNGTDNSVRRRPISPAVTEDTSLSLLANNAEAVDVDDQQPHTLAASRYA
jgi:hypothetical protein